MNANKELARQIVASLSVSGSQVRAEIVSKLSLAEWRSLLDWLDNAGLTLIYWQRLRDAGELGAAPPEVRKWLNQNLQDHELRVADMLSEFSSINHGFSEAGVTYAALKGFSLVPDYCPNVTLRTSYDFDYLVAPESTGPAERTLAAAGYIRKESREAHPIVYFHHARRHRSPSCRDELYSAAFPRSIELHYHFWDYAALKIPITLPEDPLSQIELRHLTFTANPPALSSVRAIQFHALSREDELLFQVLHVFRHILHNWCRLASLLEIAYFLERRSSDTLFWDRFSHRLGESPRVREIAGIVFVLAQRLFDAPVPPSRAAAFRLPAAAVRWIERYGEESALNNFSENKLSLFLHREFIQNESAWRAMRRARLFPLRRPSRIVQTTGPRACSLWRGRWKQGRYILQRLTHHLFAAARYAVESPRWRRTRKHRVRIIDSVSRPIRRSLPRP